MFQEKKKRHIRTFCHGLNINRYSRKCLKNSEQLEKTGSSHGSQLKVSVAPGMCRGEQRTEANQEAGGGCGGGRSETFPGGKKRTDPGQSKRLIDIVKEVSRRVKTWDS